MSPSALRKLVLGGLVTGLAGWLVVPRLLGTTGPRPAHAASSAAPEAPLAMADLALPALPNGEAAWAGDDESLAPWPADPFHRPRESAPATAETRPAARSERPVAFVLNAIISGDAPRALINERVLAVGDRLADGTTLVAIDTFSVALSGPEGTWTLELSQ